MSYILEAIKKAEKERGSQRLVNTAPHDQDDQMSTKRSIPWVAIAIFINALILMIWVGYQILSGNQFTQNDDAYDKNISTKQDSSAAIVADKPVIEVQPALDDINGNKQGEKETTNAEVYSQTELQIDNDSYNEIDSYKQNRVTDNISVDDMIDEEIPVFLSVKKQEENQQDIIASTQQKNNNQTTEVKVIDSLPIEVANIEPLPERPTNTMEQQAELVDSEMSNTEQLSAPIAIPEIRHRDVPDLEELPYSLQQQIQELVISVHIYNTERDARKVRINGQLLYEGEQINNETFVEEITPYGVIIDYAGTLFKKNLN